MLGITSESILAYGLGLHYIMIMHIILFFLLLLLSFFFQNILIWSVAHSYSQYFEQQLNQKHIKCRFPWKIYSRALLQLWIVTRKQHMQNFWLKWFQTSLVLFYHWTVKLLVRVKFQQKKNTLTYSVVNEIMNSKHSWNADWVATSHLFLNVPWLMEAR